MKKILIIFFALFAGSSLPDGRSAFEEGRFQEAYQAYCEAEDGAGHSASAALLYNKALAALHAGKLVQGEIAAEKAAARGKEAMTPMRDFLLGNIAYARCEEAEAKATGESDAAPFALDEAILHVKAAKTFWQQAAVSRPDWPEARRNVERALLKLEALKKKKDSAKEQKKKIKEQKLNPKLQPKQPDSQTPRKETRPKPLLGELSPDQIKVLLDRLAEKETEKIEMRRARQKTQRADVEKDW